MSDERKYTVDPKWVKDLKGKQYPEWPGILDAATRAGLIKLTTTLLQAPCPENGQLAIVLAHAVFEDGREFEDLGDAGPQNCSAMIASAAVRMASTRAKGRVLRDALNIGQTMWEELPDDERQAAAPSNGHSRPAQPSRTPAVRHSPQCKGCGVELPGDIYQASMQKFKEPWCPPCRKAHVESQRAAAEAVEA